ncbi:histidine phosphatase superfamily [Endogone sp. FLAS-F59071]|nr:histidine phosphatase superfamily [Endogone sp. FLAS-F59071]|eukprot:RUS18545.1 histidine phosphatase superfamily [Endogone sp. FLAS-F59071]
MAPKNHVDKFWHVDPSIDVWDPPLSPRGVLQSQKTGAYLTDLAKEKAALNHDFQLENVRVIIYTSPFQRCVETALGLARGFHEASQSAPGQPGTQHPLIRIEPGLSEWLNEQWFDEMRPAPRIVSRRLQELAVANAQVSRYAAIDWGYKPAEPHFSFPEPFHTMLARFNSTRRRVLETLRRETEDMNGDEDMVVVWVTHGAGVNALLESFKGEPTVLETDYCCLSKIKWVGKDEEAGGGRRWGGKGEEGGRWVVQMEADDKHLKGFE